LLFSITLPVLRSEQGRVLYASLNK